jgi:hypothetical protein
MTAKMRQQPGPVLRIRIGHRKNEWRVLKRIRIPEKVVPASNDPPRLGRSGRVAGFWFEAVDAQGKCLYRRVLREPPRGVELFEDDGTISRISAEPDEYSVDLLLPDLPEIENLRLFLEEPRLAPERELIEEPTLLRPVAVLPAREDDSSDQPHKERR